MKMKRIIFYFISFWVLLFCTKITAQNDSIPEKAIDSLKTKLKYGIRITGSIDKLIRSFSDDNYKGFEIAADYRLKKNLYIAIEIGTEEKTTITEYLNTTTNGNYIKAGIDLNLYENWLDMDNMIYLGFRIGKSSFNHNLNIYKIYQ